MKTICTALRASNAGMQGRTTRKSAAVKLVGCLFGVAMVFLISSQKSVAQQQPRAKTLPEVTITATTTTASDKVERAFDRNFKGAINPVWYKMNKNYLVKFIMNDQRNHALYTRNGYLIYHISYGNEQNLPYEVQKLIKANYYDYKIGATMNVQQADRNIWAANLENGKYFLMVRVEDGSLDEVEKIHKAL